MTPEQKAKAKAVIKADCKIQWRYLDDHGNTCAVGALALAANVDPITLTVAKTTSITTTRNCITRSEYNATVQIRGAIFTMFGLDAERLKTIQLKNDFNFTPTERQDAICEYIDSL